MTAVLADTHVLVWWLTDDVDKLSSAAVTALTDADGTDGIFVSAITLLDLWYATHKSSGALTLKQLALVDEALDDPEVNLHVLPITADVVRNARKPEREALRDPLTG